MNSVPPISMSKSRHCFDILSLILFLLINTSLFSFEKQDFLTLTLDQALTYSEPNIVLKEGLEYVSFTVDTQYSNTTHPSALFDGNPETHWIYGNKEEQSAVYIKIPDYHQPLVLNIIPGYINSIDYYRNYSRPKEINISLFAAVKPAGWSSETADKYKAIPLANKQLIRLEDKPQIQSFNIDLKNVDDFLTTVSQSFTDHFDYQISYKCLILKLKVASAYDGNKHPEIYISEIFFNDRLVTIKPAILPEIENIYLNENQNKLFIDTSDEQGVEVYKNSESVLQIIETSIDMRWTILVSMPRFIEGRAETTYLLFDLYNKELVNEKISRIIGSYTFGSEMYFQQNSAGLIHLNYYNSLENTFQTLELH